MRKILPLLILALATACSPKVRTQLIESTSPNSKNSITTVKVINIDDVLPASAKKLGSVKVTDGGLTMTCDYETVLRKAKTVAINAGGNLLKISRHRTPGIMSSCHQIDADIYYVDTMVLRNNTAISEMKKISLPDYEEELAKIPTEEYYQKYRFAFSGGLSYLIAKTNESVPADLKNYISELKSGSHFSVDGGYLWKENIGLGLKYSSFFSENSKKNTRIEDRNGLFRTVDISNDIHTQFIGAILYTRGYSKSRNAIWLLNTSLGYIRYRDQAVGIDNINITGSTLGAGLDFGADFKLARNFYLGLNAGYTVGVLKKIRYNSDFYVNYDVKLEKENYESMNRLDVSAGFRWAW